MSSRLDGIAASAGIGIGPAFVHRAEVPEIHAYQVDDRVAEAIRLENAVAMALERLERLEAQALAHVGSDASEIFEAHRMFLEDPSFAGAAVEIVRSQGLCAQAAISVTATELASEFGDIGDEYFAQRAADIRDIGTLVIRQLLGLGEGGFTHLIEPSVIVAGDLTPSETVSIPSGMALAFVTDVGSPTSHTAILARGLGIPAVVGISGNRIRSGVTVAVDGDEGTVWIEPDQSTIDSLMRRKSVIDAGRARAASHASEPAVTGDGHRIEVVANIANSHDAVRALELGAEGVGLFRTELLFLDRGAIPTEEEQYESYRQVFDVFGNLPVVVRTLDIGGDKGLPGIDMGEELNPFLGKRGVRFTLAEPSLFRTQIRALLRSAVDANLKLMLPMIASLAEIEAVREQVDRARAELADEGVPHAVHFEFGIMIEVPAAAITADLLAPHVDFFSIGTNDLTQYTLAADRTNPAVSSLADPFHPAVLRLIAQTIEAAHAHDKWVGLCGELAGDPAAAPLLLGLGLDEWSMSPPAIALVKERVRALLREDCRAIAATCLQATSPEQVRRILQSVRSNGLV
ncbi:MAG: phosphoenolpyruvate--protein phosphotransferase [Acidimicrobiia bacterium]